MKKTPGLTLIELIIALALVSILGTIVLLSFLNADRNELQSASLKLQADLRYAQRMALIEGRVWKVSFRSDSYIISVQSPKGLMTSVKKVQLERGIQLTRYTSSEMIYLPRGTASKGFSIYVENGRFYQTLTATVSGGRIAVSEILSS